MLIRREKQAGELQRKLQAAEHRVKQLQRIQQQQQQQRQQQPLASSNAFNATRDALQPAAPGNDHQQEEPQPVAAEKSLQQLRAELAATQSAISMLQPSHSQLLHRAAELAAAQQAEAVQLHQEAVAVESERWFGRVERLEHVSSHCVYFQGALNLL